MSLVLYRPSHPALVPLIVPTRSAVALTGVRSGGVTRSEFSIAKLLATDQKMTRGRVLPLLHSAAENERSMRSDTRERPPPDIMLIVEVGERA